MINNIRGREIQTIIQNIFGDVKGLYQSEQIQINCPKCQERDGLEYPDGKFNLEINTGENVFRCWKCEEPFYTGSLGRLIRRYGRDSDFELYKSLSQSIFSNYNNKYKDYDDYEENLYVELPKEMILFKDMDICNPEHIKAYSYMVLDRKLKKEILIKNRIGFCIDGKYRNRIIIPSYDKQGEVNYFVARSYNPLVKRIKYLNPKIDKNKIIFNEGIINWDSTIYLVEGVFEMLTLDTMNCIPLLGKKLSPLLMQYLKLYKPYVIVILDPDAYKDCIQLTEILLTIYGEFDYKVKLVKLNLGNLDLDEIRTKYGSQEVVNQLRTARHINTNDYFAFKLTNRNAGFRRKSNYNNDFTGRYEQRGHKSYKQYN